MCVFIIRALKTRTVSGISVLIAGGIYSSENQDDMNTNILLVQNTRFIQL